MSVLRLARAGVLQFTTNLLDALARESAEHALAFVDVLPLNPGRPRAPLAALDAPHGRLVQLHGLTRRYWSALPGWRHGWRHRLAARADRLGDDGSGRLDRIRVAFAADPDSSDLARVYGGACQRVAGCFDAHGGGIFI